jgi:hypothetical protein
VILDAVPYLSHWVDKRIVSTRIQTQEQQRMVDVQFLVPHITG